MFKNILVPLDGSELAEGIFPHVRTMAAAFGARVTLLRVSEAPAQTEMNVLDWRLQKAEAEAYLREQVSLLQAAGLTVDSRLLEGPAAERIVEYADQQQADLTILSSHGRGGLSAWNVSHIAQKVLQHGTMSILLVHADQTSHSQADEVRYPRILVPLDGSRRAECVLPVASTLAKKGQAELLLAHVISRPLIFDRLSPTPAESDLTEWLIDRNRVAAQQYLQELAPRIASEVKIAVRDSDNVAFTLHQLATEEAVELVLFSAHGHSAQSQWAYGNVVSNFITNSSVPLLIVQDLPQPSSHQSHLDPPRRQALHTLPQNSFASNGRTQPLSSS